MSTSVIAPGAEPQVIGRYALYDAIASGGMATVYLGRLSGSVGFARIVAIKRLHPHLAADPKIVAMLVDEARLVSRIRHPNVVPTLDVVSEQGELFLVMEYVQGEALSRLIRSPGTADRRIAADVVVTILVGILHGLHAAHEARSEQGELLGIVHRDVSPQNILVGVDGVARLVDFGVAKAAGRVGQETREGQLKGKLAYMAPEQIRGAVDRRTDIYAASVVLWEALTGRRLFSGETEIEIFAKVAEGTTTPPSTYAPGLPAILDAVTLRGLHRDPTQRYQTARDMARDLEDAIALVAPSRIGEWVEGAARSTLLDRATRMERIESDSALMAPRIADLAPARISAPGSSNAAPYPAEEDLETIYEPPSTQLSAVSAVEAVPLVARKGQRSRRIAAVVGGLSVGGILGLLALFQVWSRPTLSTAAPPEEVRSSPSASAAESPVVVPAPSATPSAAEAPRAPAVSAARVDSLARPPPGRNPASNRAVPPPVHTVVAPPPPPVGPKPAAKDDAYDHM